MSKLFSIAKINLDHAAYDYQRLSEDDCYLETCCFCLQQAIEFMLKGIVELNGAQYAENHDIRANLNILHRMEVSIPYEKELRTIANTLYQWETESRYKDSFIAAVADVEEAFVYARALKDYIEERLHPVSVEEKAFPDKKL